MEKARQTKIMFIVALVLSVTAMTLGFAAFSATLNISSSATVTPNSSDFKLKIYGFGAQDDLSAFRWEYESGVLHEEVLSDTKSVAFNAANATAEVATIDNTNLSISNMNITFSYPSEEMTNYYFYVKNIGKYTAYFDREAYASANAADLYTCKVDNSVSNDLTLCKNLFFEMLCSEMDLVTMKGVLEPGDGMIFRAGWKYEGPYFDVPVEVQWNDLLLPFTSKPRE